MQQFCVTNKKDDKKASSGLITKFTVKNSNSSAVFLENFSYLFCFFSHSETSHFSNRGSVNYKTHLQSNDAQ